MEVCHRVATTAPRDVLLPMSRFTFARGLPTSSGSFAPLVRSFTPSSLALAFSLRELEIELYTLTQPSGYAIRRDPRRVDTCQRAERRY